ncbi:unnamed protein product [Adineta steineri]|uniref:G-protein coupled receptors family 1 profile domain-containing protein n=1 Tax=Adineta steineri TaxID=433720 RepID=A0A813PI95_9BILA|nr:unnamed protein product [Adineta steineri]CAF4069736.1 unnamed protein product [Adineta steineri]
MTDTLINFAIQATRVTIPIIMTIRTVNNLLNIIILTRSTLNRHACSLYFLSMAFVNLFYSTMILLNNLLADGYQLNLSLQSNFFCKLFSYLLNLCPNISVYLIVLASIDRYTASSIYVRLRRFSDIRKARQVIGFLIFILAFLFAGSFIAFDIVKDGIPQCIIISNSLFSQIFLTIDIVLYVIIAPICMIIFGLLTIKNTNQARIISNRITHFRRTERQLSRMLLLQVGIHTILTLPFCIVFFMLILPVSFRFTLQFYYITIICKLPFYLSFTIPFFSYILSAKVYRQELIRLFSKINPIRRIAPLQIIPNSNLNPNIRINTTFLNNQ